MKLVVDQKWSELTCDQIVDRVGSRLTKRDFMVSTNLAEGTLENLSMALNGGTAASGTGFKSWEPNAASSATQPNYRAFLLDGIAPNSLVRKVVLRRAVNVAKVEMAWMKDKQLLIPCEFTGHYVSPSIRPIRLIDGT